jgi:hypothetical protein
MLTSVPSRIPGNAHPTDVLAGGIAASDPMQRFLAYNFTLRRLDAVDWCPVTTHSRASWGVQYSALSLGKPAVILVASSLTVDSVNPGLRDCCTIAAHLHRLHDGDVILSLHSNCSRPGCGLRPSFEGAPVRPTITTLMDHLGCNVHFIPAWKVMEARECS